MSKLIVCLGYHLQLDGSINPILENRLKDVAKICEKNKNSTLLLMGALSYHGPVKFSVSEASLMKEFLEKNFTQKIKGTKIIIEENTTSTVEQLCYLKKFIKKEKLKYSDLVIVCSQFFSDRVKLYAEYIFGIKKEITFIKSAIPKNLSVRFKKVEAYKLKEVQIWFKDHKKGDDKIILKEQEIFQAKVKKGEINRPIS